MRYAISSVLYIKSSSSSISISMSKKETPQKNKKTIAHTRTYYYGVSLVCHPQPPPAGAREIGVLRAKYRAHKIRNLEAKKSQLVSEK